MKKERYRWEPYLLFDYAGVEKHLSAMAAKGWQLESIGDCLWKYRKEDPAEVRYEVTYIEDAADENEMLINEQIALIEMCASSGWKWVTDWEQMQIFCSKSGQPLPIETDETVRLTVISRSMEKSFVPKQMVFILFILYAGILLRCFWEGGGFEGFSAAMGGCFLFGILGIGLMTVSCLTNLGGYLLWKKLSAFSVSHGGKCVENKVYRIYPRILNVAAFLFLLISLAALFADSYMKNLFHAGNIIIGLLYIAVFIGAWLRRCKIRRKRHEDYVNLYVSRQT